jgi:hypothetical protein
MKCVLVDKGNNIIDRIELGNEVEMSTRAKIFFLKRKQIDEKEFDSMWKVMTEEQYNTQHTELLQNKQYEWWKDEPTYLDIDIDEK